MSVYIKYAKMMCYDVNSFYIDRLKNKITIHFDDHTKTFKFDNVVLEQSTGLKDKNGKLIYEGDIVKIIDKSSRKEPFIGVVEYTNTASFEANCNGFYMHLHNPKTSENVSMIEKMFCSSLREIEVIGNIHENSDLLGEEEWHI